VVSPRQLVRQKNDFAKRTQRARATKVLFWRHNQFTYKRRYSQWERSFLCQRCGTLTNRAGIGFPQRSCKAAARYVAKFCRRGNSASSVGSILVPTQPAGESRRYCRKGRGLVAAGVAPDVEQSRNGILNAN